MPTPVEQARQCLTEEAARALDDAVAVARRRSHSQTTSLHAVSALLSFPSSLLREACSRARSNACPSRLQFRALDLSVGVSLDRLPTLRSQSGTGKEAPPVSNSLMAAIRRSQANQRRHPESFYLYQQSASVLKVEIKHFILSILDDPIVSRVFGEAGFRSYDIKLAILHPPMSSFRRGNNRSPMFLTNFPGYNMSGAPGFQFRVGQSTAIDGGLDDNLRRISNVMRRKAGDGGRRNPLIVGNDSINVINSFVSTITRGGASREILLGELDGLVVISLGDDTRNAGQLKTKLADILKEVENVTEPGILVNYGEVKEFVGRDGEYWNLLIAALKDLTDKYAKKVWLIGAVSSYDTFSAFANKFPEAERSLSLHILQISSSFDSVVSPSSQKSSLMKSFIPFGGFFPASDELRMNPHASNCNICTEVTVACPNSSSASWPSNAPYLSQIVGQTSTSNVRYSGSKENFDDDSSRTPRSQVENTFKPLKRPESSSKGIFDVDVIPPNYSTKPRGSGGETPSLNLGSVEHSSPSNSVTSDNVEMVWNRAGDHDARSRSHSSTGQYDVGLCKAVMEALTERVGRQEKTIGSISKAVARCQESKCRQSLWLNLQGPDVVGKKIIASTLAEIIYNRRESLVSVNVNSHDKENRLELVVGSHKSINYDQTIWGRTIVDELGAEVRRNPSCVIFLEGLDKADIMLQRSLYQAIKFGKFPDSCGREVSISNSIVITTVSKSSSKHLIAQKLSMYCEEEVLRARKWQMKLFIERISPNSCTSNEAKVVVSRKRNREASVDDDACVPPTVRVCFDLNLPVEESGGESDSVESVSDSGAWLEEFLTLVDANVSMNPFDFDSLAEKILKLIGAQFADVFGRDSAMEVSHDAMLQILAAYWDSNRSGAGEEWAAKTMRNALVEARALHGDGVRVTLQICKGVPMERPADGICLPAKIYM